MTHTTVWLSPVGFRVLRYFPSVIIPCSFSPSQVGVHELQELQLTGMSLSNWLGGEEEGIVVGSLKDAIAVALVDSVLVLGRHAGNEEQSN